MIVVVTANAAAVCLLDVWDGWVGNARYRHVVALAGFCLVSVAV